jgi:hypothetical protein
MKVIGAIGRKGGNSNPMGRIKLMVIWSLEGPSFDSACACGIVWGGTANGMYCAGLFWSLISSIA